MPSAEQSTVTAAHNIVAQTTNKSMNTTIGTGQVTVSANLSISTTVQTVYVTRFISDVLGQTSIAANTWTINQAYQRPGNNINWPNNPVQSVIYVWRPSTGAKVSNIIDSSSSPTQSLSGTSMRTKVFTVSGSAVTCQTGDVIVFESFTSVSRAISSGSELCVYGFDGTTVQTANNTNVTNHAAFIETPENITFGLAPSSIDMTPNAVVRVHPKPIKVV